MRTSISPMAFIEARDLVKTYSPKGAPVVRALDGLDLDVPQGTVAALLGPNGAGKTTTVKVLTTLIKPDSGTATIDGVDVLKDPQAVRRMIGASGQYAAAGGVCTECAPGKWTGGKAGQTASTFWFLHRARRRRVPP